MFESDEERINSAGIKVVRLVTGGWVHSMYSASNGNIIEPVCPEGAVNENMNQATHTTVKKKNASMQKGSKENVKELLLERAKKNNLWRREVKDTAFYEMDMQTRQEMWMNRYPNCSLFSVLIIKCTYNDADFDAYKYISTHSSNLMHTCTCACISDVHFLVWGP